MRRQTAELSRSPFLLIPCPLCGQPMKLVSAGPSTLAEDLEDITEACLECGTELVRAVKPAHRAN